MTQAYCRKHQALVEAMADYAMDRARVQAGQWLYLPRMLFRLALYVRQRGDPALV
jgi:hypothetical protein